MAKDEGDQEGSGAKESGGSRGSKSGGARTSAVSTSSRAPSNTATGTGDPDPSDHTPMIAGEEVIYAKDAEEVDTFRKPVVLEGPPSADDPGQQLVRVTKDVIEDFHHMGEKRTSQRMVMAEGTLTTRRLAEEAGVTDVEDYNP